MTRANTYFVTYVIRREIVKLKEECRHPYDHLLLELIWCHWSVRGELYRAIGYVCLKLLTVGELPAHLPSLSFSKALMISFLEIMPTICRGLALSTIGILPSPLLYIRSRIS